jgi:Coenzyme PQQ synthesis protein D (PqqD)
MIEAMAPLAPQTLVARRPDALTAAVDDELVMLDVRSSTYFGLDRIGRRIWDLIERPTSVGDLCATLEREFDVDEETCLADVRAFVAQLQAADLVDVR